MYPPLGALTDYGDLPAPGQPSDHGTIGHATFLGVDGWDFINSPAGTPVYAIGHMIPISIYPYTHYAQNDNDETQYRGWNAIFELDGGRRVVYAHLADQVAWREYAEGEQIGTVGGFLNWPHLHFEIEGILAGDLPAFLGGAKMSDFDVLVRQMNETVLPELEAIKSEMNGDYSVLKKQWNWPDGSAVKLLRQEIAQGAGGAAAIDYNKLAAAIAPLIAPLVVDEIVKRLQNG